MLLPKRPEDLPKIAESILVALSNEPLARNIVLGGGMALKHYDNFRATQDIDAWWKDVRDEPTIARIRAALESVADESRLGLEHRQFGATDSLEFKDPSSGKKTFSFQIAVRDVPLDAPLASPWPPILIETLHDNVGSKMNALVNRGAPRDFVDIYHVVQDGLISGETCWRLWSQKNVPSDIREASEKVLGHLTRIEHRRPLGSFESFDERQASEALRRWFKESFLSEGEGERG